MNINSSGAASITMTAQWTLASYAKTFSYTGAAQTWTVPYTGNYKVELWGASWGNYGSGIGHTGNGYARITYLGN